MSQDSECTKYLIHQRKSIFVGDYVMIEMIYSFSKWCSFDKWIQ